MKIESVRIINYHSIVDCEFNFPELLALVGENNAGKSNIIYALNLFFSKEKPRDKYSFNDPTKPIEIIVKFVDLTDNEKDKITDDHRDGGEFTLKKVYIYYSLEDKIERDFTSIKDGKDTNTKPRGFENVLSDTLPGFYLLPAVKHCSEETKLVKTTNFGQFLDLVFQEYNNDFQAWDNIINELKKEAEKTGTNAPLIKIAQEISTAMKEQFSNADIKLKPAITTRADILRNLDVFVDDDCDLPIFNKGQGTQRAFIFAVLRILAKKMNERRPVFGKEKKDIIIAIEEPELYLHPHQQKIIYNLLKNLAEQSSNQIQIIYSTHSSFMVHVEEYQYVGIVKKPTLSTGTKVFQCVEEIFSTESREEFQIMCQFDPERNELFFAKKVVFVEGDTEKFSLPVILDKIGKNSIQNSISIIECGSKGGIKLFLEIVNKFNESTKIIDYLVMHDKDIPWKDQNDPDRAAKEKQAVAENQGLESLCSDNPIYVFDPDFERELELQILEKNKPYRSYKEIKDRDAVRIPSTLKDFLTENL